MPRKPKNLDTTIGARIAKRRKAIGMSQDALGEALGVSFQQVQKYEKGENRIAASTLAEVSKALRMPVAYFYGGEQSSNETIPGDAEVQWALDVKYARELVVAYSHVEDERVRGKFFELVRSMAYKRPAH